MAKLLLLALLAAFMFHHTSAHALASTKPAVFASRHRFKFNYPQAFLDAHNAARAEVGVRLLKWNYTLAVTALEILTQQKYQEGCAFAADATTRQYGSNQFWDNREHALMPRDVVDVWVNKKKYYNRTTNTCTLGRICGSYTQVVWKTTVELGCVQDRCGGDDNRASTLTVCFYYPRGNVGEQRPY